MEINDKKNEIKKKIKRNIIFKKLTRYFAKVSTHYSHYSKDIILILLCKIIYFICFVDNNSCSLYTNKINYIFTMYSSHNIFQRHKQHIIK